MAVHAIFAIPSVDKRRWRRVHFAVPIRVIDTSRVPATTINTSGSQMNPGGIGFSSDAEFPVGAQVDIEFPQYELILAGVIRDHTGKVYGVEFSTASAEDNERLARFREILSSKLGPLEA